MADATKDDHYNGISLTGEAIVVLITLAISLYNSVELLLLIFITFKRWGGLYFWSLFVASIGVVIYSIGYMINYFELSHSCAGLVINNVGWMIMILGQSLVLYSRLHLVLDDRRILRMVLAMIVIDAIVFFIPTTILNFVDNYGAQPLAAGEGYKVIEKIQMTGFCLQEFILSGLYIWKAVELLKVVSRNDARRTMWQLFSINVIIVIMDLALLGVEYRNLRIYEQTFKGVVYSVKVKLEYAILGKLVQLVRSNERSRSDAIGGGDRAGGINDYIDRSRSPQETRTANPRKRSRRHDKSVEMIEHVEDMQPAEKNDVPSSDDTSGSRGEHYVQSQSASMEQVDEENGGDLYAEALRQMSR